MRFSTPVSAKSAVMAQNLQSASAQKFIRRYTEGSDFDVLSLIIERWGGLMTRNILIRGFGAPGINPLVFD